MHNVASSIKIHAGRGIRMYQDVSGCIRMYQDVSSDVMISYVMYVVITGIMLVIFVRVYLCIDRMYIGHDI